MVRINQSLKSLTNPFLIVLFLGSLIGLRTIAPVFSHPGHGDEFDHHAPVSTTNVTIEVDETTARQMGIRVESIERRFQGTGIKTTGQLETLFDQQVEVKTTTAGKVVKLLVQPGDRVEQGQPLAIVSSLELLELRVDSLDRQTEAKADLEKALADLELAKQDLERQKDIADAEIMSARTELVVAQERFERDLELEQEGALPRRQMLESKAELAKVESTLQQALSRRGVIQAEAELKRSQSAVEAARRKLNLSDRTYQTRLQQLKTPDTEEGLVTIYAPIAGIVAHREVTLGESFDEAGGKLMTLVNNQEVWATANIYEKDLGKVQLGQVVKVRVASIPHRIFRGTIEQIDSVVEGASRVIPVRTRINNAEDILKPGMFAELEIVTGQTSGAILAIPKNAVIEANSRQLVYVQNSPTTYQAVEVTLGESFSDWVEIRQGLFAGDLVVVKGANMLYAQSLRGGSQNHSDDEQEMKEVTASNQTNPWILMGMGSFIGLGAFFVGRSTNKSKELNFAFSESHSEENNANKKPI